MFVPNSSPAKTVKEFIDYAKAQPGKLIIASPGTGGTAHLAELLFLQMAGIQMTHAPYRGAAPAFIDWIAVAVSQYDRAILDGVATFDDPSRTVAPRRLKLNEDGTNYCSH